MYWKAACQNVAVHACLERTRNEGLSLGSAAMQPCTHWEVLSLFTGRKGEAEGKVCMKSQAKA